MILVKVCDTIENDLYHYFLTARSFLFIGSCEAIEPACDANCDRTDCGKYNDCTF